MVLFIVEFRLICGDLQLNSAFSDYSSVRSAVWSKRPHFSTTIRWVGSRFGFLNLNLFFRRRVEDQQVLNEWRGPAVGTGHATVSVRHAIRPKTTRRSAEKSVKRKSGSADGEETRKNEGAEEKLQQRGRRGGRREEGNEEEGTEGREGGGREAKCNVLCFGHRRSKQLFVVVLRFGARMLDGFHGRQLMVQGCS